MKNVIRLLTPHQFAKILFRVTYTHFHKLDHLGNGGGFINYIADRDIYELGTCDDKTQLIITKEDATYDNLYALKGFQKGVVEYYSQGDLQLQLHELVREITTLGSTKNPAYRFLPAVLKLNSDGTSTTDDETVKAYSDFFLFHYSIRNNGISFKSKANIDEWLTNRGLKIKHETNRGSMYITNPWNDIHDVVIGERGGEYSLSIYEPTSMVTYIGGNEFADILIYWLTNEYRCR